MTDEPNGDGADQSEELPAEERFGKAVPVVRTFLETVLGLLGVDVEVDIDIEEDGLHCDLNCSPDDGGLLIGRHGATLDALQYLTLRVLQADGLPRMRITLDVAGYRTRREKTLKQLAQSVASKVLDNRRPYHFEPMSAMERRVVHMAISEIDGLNTESEGEGRRRHVVVFPERRPKSAQG
ncbi:MAG: KH domain-containing protein [Deltaproteobacteria bacterium]|nr:KH domain-containing protein [Deltaproteobacteria bacterium]